MFKMIDIHITLLLLASGVMVDSFNARPLIRPVGNHGRVSSMIVSSSVDNIFSDGLEGLGFPTGMREALIRDSLITSRRFWVMDNSGSMSKPDGQRFVQQPTSLNQGRLSRCSRWKELQETAIFHATLAGYLQVPTEFQFLNSPGIFQKAFVVKDQDDAKRAQQTILRAEPMGATPLTACVEDVKRKVLLLLPKLMMEGTQVSLVIATDGLPTDEMGYGGERANAKLASAFDSLSGLPVSTVIRLCTSDPMVVRFYNKLDSRLELNLDILDDLTSEAKEVQAKNKWLSYGLPLHRFREGGFRSRLTDLLDERKFTKEEMRDFCGFLFGESVLFDGFPDPETDWDGFRQELNILQARENLVYNPVTKQMNEWIKLPFMGVFY